MFRLATTVPVWPRNAVGSTETVTTAGVTPPAGETETPAVSGLILKGVLLPPGSTMVTCWVETPGFQMLPRNTRSSCWDLIWGCCARLPTGRTVTPLSETEYRVLESLDRTLRPVRFSGSWRRSWSVRLLSVTTISVGDSPCTTGI